MHQPVELDLEAECRERFERCCAKYREAPFHAEKRHWLELAYLQVDIYLDHRDIQSL